MPTVFDEIKEMEGWTSDAINSCFTPGDATPLESYEDAEDGFYLANAEGIFQAAGACFSCISKGVKGFLDALGGTELVGYLFEGEHPSSSDRSLEETYRTYFKLGNGGPLALKKGPQGILVYALSKIAYQKPAVEVFPEKGSTPGTEPL